MAAEKAQILEVRNDLVRVGLPNFDGTPETYLTAEVDATGTTLTVKDNARFSQNDYVIIGTNGGQQSEIKRITGAVTAGTSLTVAALTFPHPVGTRILLTRYDQVEIYGSASSSDAAPTLIGSAVNIDVRKGYTEIKASTTYAYYYARYKDSNAGTYSTYSSAAGSGGLTEFSRGVIKKNFLTIYNEKVDDIVTEEWLNVCVNDWQRDLMQRRRNWNCLRSQHLFNTVQDTQSYDLPTDMWDRTNRASIISVKFYTYPAISNADQAVFQNQTYDHIGSQMASESLVGATTMELDDASDFPTSGTVHALGQEITYTGKSSNTLTGVTGITATLAVDTEVWSEHTTGQPNMYNINNGKIALYPIPGSAEAGKNVVVDYWKRFEDLDDDSDETLFLYPDNAHPYLWWKLAIRRKLPLTEQATRKKLWDEEVENIVSQEQDFRDIYLQPVNYYPMAY